MISTFLRNILTPSSMSWHVRHPEICLTEVFTCKTSRPSLFLFWLNQRKEAPEYGDALPRIFNHINCYLNCLRL